MADSKHKSKQETQTVGTIYTRCQNKEINIDATYQRDSIWNPEQRSEFIESVVAGIIPNNILFNIDDNGHHICIDGKQRIESIIKFKNNEIPMIKYDDDCNPICHMYYDKLPQDTDTTNKKTKKAPKSQIDLQILEKKDKVAFDNVAIAVTTYTGLSYHDQIDIFNRIQKGSKLTQGETVTSCIDDEELASKFNEMCNNNTELFEKYNKIKTERRGHYNIIANCMYIFHKDTFKLPSKRERELFFSAKDLAGKKKVFTNLIAKTEHILKTVFGQDVLGDKKVNKDIALNIIYAACYYVFRMIDNKNFKSLKKGISDAAAKLNKNIKENKGCKTFLENYTQFQSIVNNDDTNNTNDDDDEKNNKVNDDDVDDDQVTDDENNENNGDNDEVSDDGDKSLDHNSNEVEDEEEEQQVVVPVKEKKSPVNKKGSKKKTSTDTKKEPVKKESTRKSKR